MSEEQACISTNPKPTKLALAWKEVKWRLYLLSLRLFYRRFSRIIHYFGIHRMKRMHPMGGDPFYRCDWCGMHGTKVEGDLKIATQTPLPDHQFAASSPAGGHSPQPT